MIYKVDGKPWFKSSMLSILGYTILRCVTHAQSTSNSVHGRGRIASERFLLLIGQIDMAVCMVGLGIESVRVQLLLEGPSSLRIIGFQRSVGQNLQFELLRFDCLLSGQGSLLSAGLEGKLKSRLVY